MNNRRNGNVDSWMVFLTACFFLLSVRENTLAESVSSNSGILSSVPKHIALVTPPVFLSELAPWIRHRRSQGYAVYVLAHPQDVSQITAEKIRERIRRLATQVPISAVLLVGNASARPSENQTDIIPSPMLECRVIHHFGEETRLASDDWYGDFDGDGVPDAAVGRFPVARSDELESIVRKTIRYETETVPGPWCRRLQIVAGTGNFSPILDGVIESSVRHTLSETIPPSWQLSFLHADWKSSFCPSPLDFRDELIASFEAAPLFWAYFGHGRHRMLDPLSTPLGYAPTLSGEDFPRLRCRGTFPIAMLFCCYGGMLDRDTPSLAEEMILQNEGPVAVIAASRTTMPYGMSVFGVELFNGILDGQHAGAGTRLEIGSLILHAKRRMLLQTQESERIEKKPFEKRSKRVSVRAGLETMAKSFDPTASKLPIQLEEHAAMFHLFGDPLLGILLPGTIKMTCPERCKSGEVIRVEGSVDPKGSERAKNRSVGKTNDISVLHQTDFARETLLLELVPAMDQLVLRSPDRGTCRLDDESRRKNNEEYRHFNDRVMRKWEVPISNGRFSTDIVIPENLQGRYVLRASCFTTSCFYCGYSDLRIFGRRGEGKHLNSPQ